MFATGVTMDLAEWIIDDTCLVDHLNLLICNIIFTTFLFLIFQKYDHVMNFQSCSPTQKVSLTFKKRFGRLTPLYKVIHFA